MKHPLPHIGLRMIKTALSVSLCMLAAWTLSYPPPIYACIAAVIVTRETVEDSFKQGVARVIATLIGGVMALGLLLLDLENSPGLLEVLLAGVGVLLTLYVCLLLKTPDAAALACVTFLIIVLQHADDKYLFALYRVLETIAGIIVSLVVNRIIPVAGKRQKTHNQRARAR